MFIKKIIDARAHKRYRSLLFAIVLRLLTYPFIGNRLSENIFGSCIGLYLLITIIISLIKRKNFVILLSILALAFSIELIGKFNFFPDLYIYFEVTSVSIYCIYLGLAIWIIAVEILEAREVSIDLINGSICIYLLIGILWSIFYSIIDHLDPAAFSSDRIEGFKSSSMNVYLSFTTLTTLGYGDIYPVNKFALIACNLEAIIGQLYPSTFIAILVSRFIMAIDADK